MKKLNLSEWALRNSSLVRYLMIVLMVAGLFSYTQLGQKEDPEFTFKAMMVRYCGRAPPPRRPSSRSRTRSRKSCRRWASLNM